MQLRFTLILGTLGLAAALVAAPVGVQDNIASLHEKAAFAAPGGGQGQGRGNGHGRGHGGGQGLGNSASFSVHGGSGPGKSGSAPGHGGTGHGQAVGHDAVSGVSSHSAHLNGLSASDLEGNLNAAHASAQAFENAEADSMVGAIAEAVKASFVSANDPNTVIDQDEIDSNFAAALGAISNKTVDGAVAEGVAEGADGAVAGAVAPGVDAAVRDLVDGKVSEPSP